MATFTASPSNWTNNSDANFRAWGSYVSARFLAVGLVQTADTGQINWTTVTAPTTARNYPGYEIWRFDDALQASAPIYFKASFGSGDTSLNNTGIRFVFGTGSDGAGNLTGTLSNDLYAEGASQTGAGTIFGSGSTNRFVFAPAFGSVMVMIFGFERLRDANGDETSEGIYWFARGQASAAALLATQVWNRSTGAVSPTLAASFAALFPLATGITGVQTIVAPIFPEKGIFGNPCLNGVGYYTGDIAAGSITTVYMYGQPHTYYFIASANSWTGSAWRGGGSGTEALAIRYE